MHHGTDRFFCVVRRKTSSHGRGLEKKALISKILQLIPVAVFLILCSPCHSSLLLLLPGTLLWYSVSVFIIFINDR